MRGIVTKSYRRPYDDPIAVAAGDQVTVDTDRYTDIEGWVWCTAMDGRGGWTPKKWLVRSSADWIVNRDFNAIELTVEEGDELELISQESDFFWVRNSNGDLGWVPTECVTVLESSG